MSTDRSAMAHNPDSYEAFEAALGDPVPPVLWSPSFQALWWDAKGDWEQSHAIAQDLETSWGCWLHAYLHRKEGDIWNARYWYGQAGVAEATQSLEEEFKSLIEALLSSGAR